MNDQANSVDERFDAAPATLSRWSRHDTTWMLGLFGTAIGAGTLFLPINAGLGGFWPLLILALLAFPMTFYAHRGLTRFVLSGREGSDITDVVEEHFGLRAGALITLLYFCAIFPILLIYSVALTNTVGSFMLNQLHVTPPPRAILSLVLILSLAYTLDHSLATNSIILIGVIFSMFISSVINLILSFVNDQVRSIAFWTMGSLSGTGYPHTRILSLALLLCGGVIVRHARELNAFAIGEDNARHVGVNVRRVKLAVLVTVSVLIGVCVSISGSIGFVGLVVPHAARMIAGPNHRRLLPASMFAGAIFLLLADLIARTLLSPVELSIGVVTSLVGAVAFVVIFYRARKAG